MCYTIRTIMFPPKQDSTIGRFSLWIVFILYLITVNVIFSVHREAMFRPIITHSVTPELLKMVATLSHQ